MSRTKKITAIALLSAFSLIAFVIESLLPPLFIPSARLGVSNVFILFAVVCFGWYFGYPILIVKIVLGSIITGNISSVIYSLPAGVISLSLEILLFVFAKRISIVAVSALGGVINLLIQNATYCLVLGSTELFIYSPYLALLGVLAGAFVGIAVYLLIKYIPLGKLSQNKQTDLTEK